MDIKLYAHLFGIVWRSPGADRTHLQQAGVMTAGVEPALQYGVIANLGARPGVCRAPAGVALNCSTDCDQVCSNRGLVQGAEAGRKHT